MHLLPRRFVVNAGAKKSISFQKYLSKQKRANVSRFDG